MPAHMARRVNHPQRGVTRGHQFGVVQQVIGAKRGVHPFATALHSGVGQPLHGGRAARPSAAKGKDRRAGKGRYAGGCGGVVQMGMGDNDFRHSPMPANRGHQRIDMRGDQRPRIDQHQITPAAKDIAVGAGACHGRRVWRHNAAHAGRNIVHRACLHLRPLSFGSADGYVRRMRLSLKPYLPRGLFGRAALILIVPIVTIQLVVSIAFIQRHFEGVTRQLSQGVLVELDLIRKVATAGGDGSVARADAKALATAFGMGLNFLPDGAETAADAKLWRDLTGNLVIDALRAGLPDVRRVDLASVPGGVVLTLALEDGLMRAQIPRGRLSASNPHQLLVLMIVASILMTLISYAFLRNQLRPIARLAQAAESFGKGEAVPFRPRGATEVRAAGAAFLDMRHRIERAIETRTLMLSGISHDLRTPLTRLRLGLAMLPEDPEVTALLSDVIEMERLVDEFLTFARGDAMEDAVMADPLALAAQMVVNMGRSGREVTLIEGPGPLTPLRMRPWAVQRAVENLLSNALRHAASVRLTLTATDRVLRFVVEDDGPGIPEVQHEAALMPFARLDTARNQNHGGGVGLGLSIAADVARSHGGGLSLGRSGDLGGLRAELRIAR